MTIEFDDEHSQSSPEWQLIQMVLSQVLFQVNYLKPLCNTFVCWIDIRNLLPASTGVTQYKPDTLTEDQSNFWHDLSGYWVDVTTGGAHNVITLNSVNSHYLTCWSLLTLFNFNPNMDIHMPGKVWDEITNPFPNFKDVTVKA